MINCGNLSFTAMNTILLAFVGFILLIIRFSSKLGLYTVKLQKEVIINAVPGIPEYRKTLSRLITHLHHIWCTTGRGIHA